MPKITKSASIFNTRGILLEQEPMWSHTSFSIGGNSDFFAVPSDLEDLRNLLLNARHANLGTFILGGGSNLLVADLGIRGLVIDMRNFDSFESRRNTLILGSGLPVSDAAWRAGSAGMAGLDFLFGMPGTVGGALWMNARCYGAQISNFVDWVEVMDWEGRVGRMLVPGDEWGYKKSLFQRGDYIIIRAGFKIAQGDSETLKRSMLEKREDRLAKGHYRFPCAGSAFKNNRKFGAPSGVLIDRCGMKGYRVGGAAISAWHGNIVINDRGAAAADIETVLLAVARRVEAKIGVRLEREILFVGDWNNE